MQSAVIELLGFIAGTKTDFAIDPAILNLLPAQGSVELQHDAAGKVHHFHTHPVDEILMIVSGRLNFSWKVIFYGSELSFWMGFPRLNFYLQERPFERSLD